MAKLAPAQSTAATKMFLGGRLPLLLRWMFGVVFVWAAVSKLADRQAFYGQLLNYRLPLPDSWLHAVAVVLPFIEALCGVWLLSGLWQRAATALVLLLSFLFVACTGQAWARGLDLSCGCLDLSFLGLDKNVSAYFESASFACLRSAVMFVVALYLLRVSGSKQSRRDA